MKFRFLHFVIGAVVIRFIFSLLPPFEIDMNSWLGWAYRLAEVGPHGFYYNPTGVEYPPGFLYWLWIVGTFGFVHDLAIKIPVLVADLATAFLIRSIIAESSKKRLADIAFFAYFLNPVVIFTSSIWGQIDGILTFFMLLASIFYIKGKVRESGVSWALAFLIKPQAIFLAPAFLFIALVSKFDFKAYFNFAAVAIVTILALSLPFFPNNPFLGLVHQIQKMAVLYPYKSVNAFNFWVFGMWEPDSIVVAGLSYYVWGIFFYLVATGVIFFRFRKTNKLYQKYLVIALTILAAFLFPTRVHERYLFPMFAFLIIAAVLSGRRYLYGTYMFFSGFNLVNLYYPYAYYNDNILRNQSLLQISGGLGRLIGVLSILAFTVLNFFTSLVEEFSEMIVKNLSLASSRFSGKYTRKEEKSEKFVGKYHSGTIKKLLLAVLVFAFASRVFALSSPKAEYFDEVYHAFTARLMLNGDVKAWEWWNNPPEGFAYEWTHPPLAKFGMVLGMSIFGENSFGWRIPGAILGVISVYLVYLIAKKIFEDELIGVISAAIFSLDGLFLVISRIGMNDVYFLTFALASLYLYLVKRDFWSAIFFGLSLSSKWSAIWLVPIIMAAHFVVKRKLTRSYLWFLLLPPIIYVASYVPFFTSGHTLAQFFNINAVTKCFGELPCDEAYGVQQQMWWYHTNLDATHAYTSPWWSWPVMLRPVYLYTSELVNNLVARIYLIGNPVVFWGGLLAVLVGLFVSFVKRNKMLGFVIFCYLFFFVPWAASPRIMFLYHYLPSIPFMAIVLAYFLRKVPKLIPVTLVLMIITFVYFFPHWTGLYIPVGLDSSYYWFSSWR